jgi:soluble lytic murein transglycosylase-like protein
MSTNLNTATLNEILDDFEPAGASDRTARQDRLPQQGIRGVAASEAMAQTDRARVMLHKEKFKVAGSAFGLPPALLAAIASRETRGRPLTAGDHGHGFGLMQVDDQNSVVRTGGPAGQPHINQATGILRDKLTAVKRRFPDLTEVEQLEAAVSRYNGGRGLAPPDSDRATTGGDYMNDVWARARFYARVESWD